MRIYSFLFFLLLFGGVIMGITEEIREREEAREREREERFKRQERWDLRKKTHFHLLLPHSFRFGDDVEIEGTSLTSLTPPSPPLPYNETPICAPPKVKFGEEVSCLKLCSLPSSSINDLIDLIYGDYVVNWKLDTLPVLYEQNYFAGEEVSKSYTLGFPVGTFEQDKAIFYNHLVIYVHINKNNDNSDLYHIVSFRVHPDSHVEETNNCFQVDHNPLILDPSSSSSPSVFISVAWIKTDNLWDDRWEIYTSNSLRNIVEWHSVISSLTITIILSGVIAIILNKTLSSSLSSSPSSSFSSLPTTSSPPPWSDLAGDIFREPSNFYFLLTLVSAGCQLICSLALVLIFSVFRKELYPHSFYSLLFSLLIASSIIGVIGGYLSSYFFHFTTSSRSYLLAFLGGGGLSGLASFMSLIGSEVTETETTTLFFHICVLSLVISLPSSFLGCYLVNTSQKGDGYQSISETKRIVPKQPWYLQKWMGIIIGGILPLSSIYVELFSLLSSLVFHQYLLIFTFWGAILVLFLVTSAEVSIFFTYLQITSEDYNWWWNAFLIPAGSGIYIFIYSYTYLYHQTPFLEVRPDQLPFLKMAIFHLYNLIFSLGYGLMAGSAGFLSSFWFLKLIFSGEKAE